MKRSHFNRLSVKLFVALVVFLSLERFCYKETAGFREHKILSGLSLDSSYEKNSLPDEIQKRVDEVLTQNFSFLGSGVQSYAFVSEDQNAVLKFFKQHRTKTDGIFFQAWLPSILEPYRQKLIRQKSNRKEAMLKSFKLALDICPEETGLFYLHINPDELKIDRLTFYDKLKSPHTVPINEIEFALQKKTIPIKERLPNLLEQAQYDQAEKLYNSLYALCHQLTEKNIINTDTRHLINNIGFDGETPLIFDLGSFAYSQDEKELNRSLDEMEYQLNRYLEELTKKYAPDFSPIRRL